MAADAAADMDVYAMGEIGGEERQALFDAVGEFGFGRDANLDGAGFPQPWNRRTHLFDHDGNRFLSLSHGVLTPCSPRRFISCIPITASWVGCTLAGNGRRSSIHFADRPGATFSPMTADRSSVAGWRASSSSRNLPEYLASSPRLPPRVRNIAMTVYHFRATPLTPIHVGDGNSLAPEDYLIEDDQLIQFNRAATLRDMKPETRRQLEQRLDSNDFQAAQEILRKSVQPRHHRCRIQIGAESRADLLKKP